MAYKVGIAQAGGSARLFDTLPVLKERGGCQMINRWLVLELALALTLVLCIGCASVPSGSSTPLASIAPAKDPATQIRELKEFRAKVVSRIDVWIQSPQDAKDTATAIARISEAIKLIGEES
jgi:hypothetical protein